MDRNQNETGDCGLRIADCGITKRRGYAARAIQIPKSQIPNPKSAFTLTELLVVITIIAILAGLITGAAVEAWKRAQQVAITQELKQLGNQLEDFKNTFGAYPPNGMSPAGMRDNTTEYLVDIHADDFVLMFRKAFPRHNEPEALIRGLAGFDSNVSPDNPLLEEGMRGTEALVFWLGGFSEDTRFPISGPGGPSYRIDVTDPIEDLTTRNRRYEFDLGRLGPRDSDGSFDAVDNGGEGRFVVYRVDLNGDGNTTGSGEERQINFWRYTPSGSVEPIVYFDASRHRAQVAGGTDFVNNYDPWFYSDADPTNPELRYALKRFNETGGTDRTEFVNQGKFQLLHCGIDDIWGDFTVMNIGVAGNAANTILRFPTGPFLEDVADTVGNFMGGTLADEQE